MSDIQQRIANVLHAQDVAWCDKCDTYKRIDEHIEHVAEVLVSELGLTQEWSDDIAGPDWGRYLRWVTPSTFHPGPHNTVHRDTA